MKPRQIVSPQEMTAVLDQAVRERALATLSLTCANEWICYKSRFLERDPNRRFFVLDWGVEGGEPKIELGQYVGISFRYRSRKVMFSTVLEARGRFMAETDTPTPAARYRWPESLTEIQRRAYYRTPIPAGVGLLASMWAGGRTRRTAAQKAALGVVRMRRHLLRRDADPPQPGSAAGLGRRPDHRHGAAPAGWPRAGRARRPLSRHALRHCGADLRGGAVRRTRNDVRRTQHAAAPGPHRAALPPPDDRAGASQSVRTCLHRIACRPHALRTVSVDLDE
jgi:hypothetical protein